MSLADLTSTIISGPVSCTSYLVSQNLANINILFYFIIKTFSLFSRRQFQPNIYVTVDHLLSSLLRSFLNQSPQQLTTDSSYYCECHFKQDRLVPVNAPVSIRNSKDKNKSATGSSSLNLVSGLIFIHSSN